MLKMSAMLASSDSAMEGTCDMLSARRLASESARSPLFSTRPRRDLANELFRICDVLSMMAEQ